MIRSTNGMSHAASVGEHVPTQPVSAAPVSRRDLRVRPTRPARRTWPQVARSLMSVGAMLGVGAMLVSTSISGGDFGRADPVQAAQAEVVEAASSDVQSIAIAPQAAATMPVIARDAYTAQSKPKPVAKPLQFKFASADFAYSANPGGAIRWPFPYVAPISYGYGPRVACSYCSSFHLGVDFTPGSGVPIHAIADGVVSSVKADQGGLGNHVTVDHVVNGQRVQSIYAHMAWGSIQVATGQQIAVGTVIGGVGSTGASTGAHLHLEIHVDGTPIDPFAWLKANAG
jgi:murein DD-endopeptidase MepM/ murein hydrolase activator NlpD